MVVEKVVGKVCRPGVSHDMKTVFFSNVSLNRSIRRIMLFYFGDCETDTVQTCIVCEKYVPAGWFKSEYCVLVQWQDPIFLINLAWSLRNHFFAFFNSS